MRPYGACHLLLDWYRYLKKLSPSVGLQFPWEPVGFRSRIAQPKSKAKAPRRSRFPGEEDETLRIRQVKASTLDQIERWTFVLVYALFAFRMVKAFVADGEVVQLLYLFDQFIVLIFFLFRRSTEEITNRLGDWFAGLAGSCLPLLIGPIAPEGALAPQPVAAFILLFGAANHIMAKLTLRRSFGAIAANRGIKASGPYSIVRHPMYLGYMLVQVSLLLAGPTLRNVVIILLTWILFLWRISAEERILAKDPEYQIFMEKTPRRLIPGVY